MNQELFLTTILFIVHTSCAIDNYLIACGSSRNITYLGRTFLPDSQHSSVQIESENSFVVSSRSSSTLLSPIYQSARTFTSPASYKFDINQKGWHFIRLYFHPLSQRLASVSSLTVVTENYVLINNNYFFNRSSSLYLFKEYAINVDSKTFTLIFVPSRNSNIVFVNAIEVVSIPNEVFSFDKFHTSPSFPYSHVALETMSRLNMGGSSASVTLQDDTLFRIWEDDDKYLKSNSAAVNISVIPASLKSSFNVVTFEVAPKEVYATAKSLRNIEGVSNSNLTWVLPVNPSFKYLIRMHFCDIISKSKHKLLFNVYVNSNIVVKDLNLSALTYDVGVPFFIDCVANSMIGDSEYNLSVSVKPSELELSQNAIMNGLEIMKISNDVRSLDGLSSLEDIFPNTASKISKVAIILSCSVGAPVSLALFGASYYYYCCFKPKKTNSQNDNGLARPRKFTFQEIQEATNNFAEQSLLGDGGFGKVYMGMLENGTKVAIKRANPESKQGLTEFQNEIDLLSKLHHHHLICLIGYCHEDTKMILVYEYMANGPLSNHLYGQPDIVVPLSWKQRLEICIGAARGLHYLHTGNSQCIIHRDVKPANILLDENFLAKVSDFGISRKRPVQSIIHENFVAKVLDFGISRKGPSLHESYVRTVVKGSFGYLDPEYFRTQLLTEKSDVYSFGVVLLEVLCGRPALNLALPTQEKNLARWALSNCHENNGELSQEIIDPSLIGKAKVESMKEVWKVATMCLEEYRFKRPTMEYVMCSLEGALHLELRISDHMA